jgi:uncharacterized membrane protein YdjX (TVP38/TMEM64 family)
MIRRDCQSMRNTTRAGKHWKKIALFVLLVAAVGTYTALGLGDYLTFEMVKEHRAALRFFVDGHYATSVIVFIAVYLSTALFVPGAVVLTLAAGFLFGVVAGVVYVNIAATTGAVLAFLCSRYLIGKWIQKKFSAPLKSFNREIERHGQNYLLVLRIIPLFPFFAVNYLAGITKIPLPKFIWTTALGMLPGSVLYAYAGQRLGEIEQVVDLFSAEFIIAFSILALLAFSPVVVRFVTWLKARQ